MTYQGERARAMATEQGRHFEVSQVRLGGDGQVSEVMWVEVAAGPDHAVGVPVRASAAEVVDALHDGADVVAAFAARSHMPERRFEVVPHEDGRASVVLAGPPSPGRELGDLAWLADAMAQP